MSDKPKARRRGRRPSRIAAALGLCVTAGLAAPAPAGATVDDGQLWAAAFVNGPVADDGRLLVWFDGHARFRDDFSALGVSILRPGVGWKIGDGAALWAGYAHILTHRAGAPDITEHRIWQQATYRLARLGGVDLLGRTRLEQRFVEGADDTGWRLRQWVRAEKRFSGSAFSAIASNEVFIALNDADFGAAAGYDQTRAFIGAGYRPGKATRIEAGYLLNHIRREAAPDRLNHALSLTFFLNL